MAFSDAQKERFIGLLESKGWQMRDGTIWSASGGLWLGNSHFGDSSPSGMREMFARRAERIEKMKLGDWQTASRENQEASLAAQDVIDI